MVTPLTRLPVRRASMAGWWSPGKSDPSSCMARHRGSWAKRPCICSREMPRMPVTSSTRPIQAIRNQPDSIATRQMVRKSPSRSLILTMAWLIWLRKAYSLVTLRTLASARLCSVMSMKEPIMPLGRPVGSLTVAAESRTGNRSPSLLFPVVSPTQAPSSPSAQTPLLSLRALVPPELDLRVDTPSVVCRRGSRNQGRGRTGDRFTLVLNFSHEATAPRRGVEHASQPARAAA
jgi:hypothetical protein